MTDKKNYIIIADPIEESVEFIKYFHQASSVNLVGVIDQNKNASSLRFAQELNIPTSQELDFILRIADLNGVINLSQNPQIQKELTTLIPAHIELLGRNSATTFRKLIEEGINKALDRQQRLDYKDVFDLLAVVIVEIDKSGVIRNVNKYISQWLGFQPDQVIGKNIFMLPLLPKESKVKILENFSDHLQAKGATKLSLLFKDAKGDVKHGLISETILTDPQGVSTGFLVTITDAADSKPLQVSDNQQSSGQVQLAQEHYKTIFENSAVAIMFADEHEHIISWNRFTENLFGYAKEDLYLKPVRTLYPNEEWQKIRSFDIRNKGMQDHLETRIYKKDGSLMDIDISISVLRDNVDNIIGSIGIIRDITERKIAEKKIQEVHRMRNDFMAMVSHELKTPLTAIKGSLGIVLDGMAGEMNDEQKDFLVTAKRNVDRLDLLINDVLDFQKLELGRIKFEFQQQNINRTLEEVKAKFAPLAKNKNISLNLDLDEHVPPIVFDKKQIVKVLDHLITNAMKFTHKGGITLKSSKCEDLVCIAIEDTGEGIKEEDLDKLFQSFTQIQTGSKRDTGSTGLGLAIAKSIIEKHGGKIWVESTVGTGSVFYFLLSTNSDKLRSED
ncbi:MAG: PAS domain S-box protein [Candidatus Omnitrophica bacterium]|nr:PAS domain S-box protein [Candidatus Omnitrophota bacterium]